MQAVYIRSDIHCILVVHLVASDNQTGFSKKNILPYQFLKFCYKFYYLNHFKMYSSGASLVAQLVKKKKKKNLPAMWEMRVQSLVWEDLLEKEMATYSNILA